MVTLLHWFCHKLVSNASLLQVRAASSLLSITHSLKLLWLLSDEEQIVEQREVELGTSRAESEEAKARAVELLDQLLQTEQ